MYEEGLRGMGEMAGMLMLRLEGSMVGLAWILAFVEARDGKFLGNDRVRVANWVWTDCEIWVSIGGVPTRWEC